MLPNAAEIKDQFCDVVSYSFAFGDSTEINKRLTTASIAHLQWMSSDSLYLSRFSGTSPSLSGSNPKSLQHTIPTNSSTKFHKNSMCCVTLCTWKEKKRKKKKSKVWNFIYSPLNYQWYLPWGRAIKVRWTRLARHPVSWHGDTRGAIDTRKWSWRGKFGLWRWKEWRESSGNATAHQCIGGGHIFS